MKVLHIHSDSIKHIQFLFIISILITLTACSTYKVVDDLPFRAPVTPIAIVNVNVLSQDGESMLANRTIYIQDGKIIEISERSNVANGTTVIDGTGKYVIPGLVESHAHLKDSPNDLLVFVAHGVTFIREMTGNSHHLQWHKEIKLGRIGPKMYIASEKVESRPGISGSIESRIRKQLNVTSQEDASELAYELAENGYQSIKIGSFINKQMYLAVTQSARRAEIAVTGHIPHSITLEEFWAANHQEVAHIEEFSKALNNEFGAYNSDTAGAYLEYVRKRSDEVAVQLKQRNIAVGSTLWVTESFPQQALALQSIIERLDLSYSDPKRVAKWLPGENSYEHIIDQTNEPETARRIQVFWDTYVEAVHILLRAFIKHDVVILAGTDTNLPLVVPGISIHHELQSLVNNGMSRAQALRSATLIPGQWMNSNTGIIAAGYDADLIILTDNPLTDISNTQKIDTVILAGKILDRPKIDGILQSVREAYATEPNTL